MRRHEEKDGRAGRRIGCPINQEEMLVIDPALAFRQRVDRVLSQKGAEE